jgi:mono/diheme cytochrome c family protein
VAVAVTLLWTAPAIRAQNASFHNAPAAAAAVKNPFAGQAQAAAAGKKLYAQNCSQCHGNNLQGMGPAPALDNPSTKNAKPGELFWFITNGNLNNGMPSWSQMPKPQRWQIVTFLESKINSEGAGAN